MIFGPEQLRGFFLRIFHLLSVAGRCIMAVICRWVANKNKERQRCKSCHVRAGTF